VQGHYAVKLGHLRHRLWYQLKARMRLHINDSTNLHVYPSFTVCKLLRIIGHFYSSAWNADAV